MADVHSLGFLRSDARFDRGIVGHGVRSCPARAIAAGYEVWGSGFRVQGIGLTPNVFIRSAPKGLDVILSTEDAQHALVIRTVDPTS